MFDIANNTEFLTAIGINDAPEDVKAKLITGIEELAKERLITKVPDFSDLVTEVFTEIKNEILEHKMNVVGQ